MNFEITKRLIYIPMFLAVLSGCSNPPEKLGRLDVKKWRGDRGSCKNERTSLVADFKAEQQQLVGESIEKVGEILGRPDIHELGDRGVKFYVYFLEKGPQCENTGKKSDAKKVVLKFNAIGLLSEITYQDKRL